MAATIAGGEMRFDIVADPSQFNQAVAAAQANWARATADMKAEVADSSSTFAEFATGVQETIKNAGTSLADGLRAAMSGSVDGVETATVAMLSGLQKKAESFWDGFGSLGERWLGKWGKNLGDVVGRAGKSATNQASASLAEKAVEAFDAGKIEEANKLVGQYAALLDEATGSAGALADKWKAIVEGSRQGLEVFAGKAMSAEQLAAITAELEKQTQQYKDQAELIGKSASDRAQLLARRRIADMEGLDKASDKQTDKIDDAVAGVGSAAAQAEAARKAEEQRKGFEYITGYLERQMELTEARTREIGKTAGAIAEERAQVDAETRMRQKGRDLTVEEADLVQDMAMRWGEIAERSAHAQRAQQASNAQMRSIAQSQVEIGGIGMNPGALASYKFQTDQLLQAKERNIQLTAEEIAKIDQQGRSVGMFAQKAAEAKNAYAELQAVGQTVSRNIEDVFGKMIQGTKVNFRELFAQLALEIAKITLRYQVLQPLLGGGASGGGLLAGLLGFGGARASGGPVSSGTGYLVGERGPEWFQPQSAGSITPNHALAGGGRGGEIVVTVVASPELHATIQSTAEGVVARQAPAIVGSAVSATQRALPGMISNAQRRTL